MTIPGQRAVPLRVTLVSPILKLLLGAGIPVLANRLVTIRGRTTGIPRTTPLAVIEYRGRRWVWAPWGDVQWAKNLRAAGRAVVAYRDRHQEVTATELDPVQRVGFFRDVLGPVARAVPFGVSFIRMVDQVDVDDPVAAADGRRVFELHPIGTMAASSASRSARRVPGRDIRERIVGGFLRLFNPLVRAMVAAGLPTGAPNVLLTVRGRRTGRLRTVPVGMVEFEARRFVQASYGTGGWVENLRAASEAMLDDGHDRLAVRALELTPDEAGALLLRLLGPYHRSRIARALLGPRMRPPIGVLCRLRLRIDDTLEEYVAEARRHPLFELRPIEGER